MKGKIFIGDAAFIAAVGFLAGILAASWSWNPFAMLMVAIFGVCGIALFTDRTYLSLSVIAVAGFFFGLLYYNGFVALRVVETKLPSGKTVTFSAIVKDEPRESVKSMILDVTLQKPYTGEVTIFAPLGNSAQYGDLIQVSGEISQPDSPGDDPSVFPNKIKFLAAHRGFWLREKLIDLKAAILEKFNDVLPGDTAALLGGEAIGGMGGMSADLKNKMAVSGTSYITAMYGYKIMVIAMLIMDGLADWIMRRMRFFLALLSIALFAMMAGGGASVVRGAIMAALVLIASESGRVYNSRNAFTLTGAFMALLNPTAVAQAAFLLSFLSLLGIMYLTKPLKRLFGFEDSHGGGDISGEDETNGPIAEILDWREAVVIAIASLLPIIPVIAGAFGDFSLTAFPSNALVFPAVPIAMMLGIVLACAGFVSHYLALFIAPAVNVLLAYQFAVINIFSAFSIPLPIVFDAPFAFVVYYASLIFFIYRYS